MPGPDPKPVKRKKGKPKTDLATLAAAKEWHDKTVAFGCRVCPTLGRECEGAVLAHHVLRKQFIRGYLDDREQTAPFGIGIVREDLERALMWDLRNGMGVCYRAHRRHHNRIEPIPRNLVTKDAWTFAAELGLSRRLEADYP